MRDTYFILEDGILASASLLFGPAGTLVTAVEMNRKGRGRGFAQRVLNMVLEDADREGVELFLSVDPQEPTVDFDRLAAFYLRNGFTWVEGATMRREPGQIGLCPPDVNC